MGSGVRRKICCLVCRRSKCVDTSVCGVHAEHKTQKLESFFHPLDMSRTGKYLYPGIHPNKEARLKTSHYSCVIHFSPHFLILIKAQLIRKWTSLPKEAGSCTKEAFFCQWLYQIPLPGHWAILKAISSITPTTTPLFLPPSPTYSQGLTANLCHGII